MSESSNIVLETASRAEEIAGKAIFYGSVAGLALGYKVNNSYTKPGKPLASKGGEQEMASRSEVVEEARNMLDRYEEEGKLTSAQADHVYTRVQKLAGEYEDAEQAIYDIVDGITDVDTSGYEQALDTLGEVEGEISGALERGNRTLQSAASMLGLNNGEDSEE